MAVHAEDRKYSDALDDRGYVFLFLKKTHFIFREIENRERLSSLADTYFCMC